MSEILRIEGIVVEAGDRRRPQRLLDGVSLTLDQGEVLGLIGESGAGKTTLGLATLGHVRHGAWIAGGRVLYRGTDVLGLGDAARRQLLGRRIAYVAQSAYAAFNPARTILDQVAEGPVEHGMATPAEARRRAVALFAELDLPAPEQFGARYPHQVSGGQLQRAMLAMAMACQPDILVLDEPTTALDVTTQIEVLAALKNLIRDHGTAGLYISHDLAVVGQMADRMMILRHGRTVEVGETRRILEAPVEAYTRELVSIRRHAAPLAPDSGIREAGTALQPLLVVEGLGASYGERRVVGGVSLTVGRGETCAVVGESGSGKSTLARIICGLKPADSGEVRLDGRRLEPRLEDRPRAELGRLQLIYQSPDLALNPRQTVATAVGRPLAFYRGLRGQALAERVRGLLEMMELPPALLDRLPGQLSGGQKQRVCIARALAADPDLLICDEITAALDPIVAEGLLRLLRDLQARTRIACLFITHDLEVVRKIAHRVVVMERGAVRAAGPIEAVFSPPHHPYTAKLLASVPEMRVGWLDEAIARRGLV